MKKLLTTVFVLLVLTSFAQKTYLHCGKLIDVEKGKILTEMTVVVEGERIVAVTKGYAAAGSNDRVIDLKNKTVMPGLMDMHVHIESQYDKGRYARVFKNNPADIAFRSTVFANRVRNSAFDHSDNIAEC